jgi:hypothetical protein
VATDREERLAQNEALFRVANERMAEWEEIHADDSAESYFCECADPDCREKVSLRRSEYESVRSHPRHFFIVVGHEIPDVETVIETHGDWCVIEKDPSVSDLLNASDPRRK